LSTLTYTLKYSLADAVGIVGQQPYKEKAKKNSLFNWKYIDKLNKLTEFVFSIPNDEFGRANALIEREVFVPFLKPFHGIVCEKSLDDHDITLVVCELSFHLTRKVFRVDGEEEITYTTENWYNSAWKYRRLIHTKPKDINAEQTDITLRLNVASNTGFKNHAKSNGFDFRITKKDGITLVNHERKSYTSGTGALDLYFEAARVSPDADTDFYIYYGNPDAVDGSIDITDVDPNIDLEIHSQEQYQITVEEAAQQILDSANEDMPSGMTWKLADGFPTNNITGTITWKNHFDALHILGEILGKDVWFDNKEFKVYMGTKGKTIDDDLDIVVTSVPNVSTDEFANTINLLGKKLSSEQQIESQSTTSTVLRYNYEKTIVDNSLSTQGQVDGVANALLDEFQNPSPKIKGEIPYNQFVRFSLESGDIIKISQPSKQLNGSFRVMDISATQQNVSISLESTETGKMRTRSLSMTDIIEGILKRLEEQSIDKRR